MDTYPRAILYALVCSIAIFLVNVLGRDESAGTAFNDGIVFFLVVVGVVSANVWIRRRSKSH